MLKDLIKLADQLDRGGHHMESDMLDSIIQKMAKEKTKSRTRPKPVFESTHPKVLDNKDHFPIDTAARARNALARVNQYDEAPPWWDGSLESLVSAVVRAVKKQYKDIDVSKAAEKPKKG